MVDHQTTSPVPGWLRPTAWTCGVVSAAVAAALGAVGLSRAALALLGLAVAAFGVASWMSLRTVVWSLNSINADRGRDDSRVRDAVASQVDRQSTNLSRTIVSVEKQVRSLPYVSAELGRRHSQLIHDDLPMPILGADWAVTAPTILFIIDEVLGTDGRRRILECGSGASTIWAAAALRHRGEGRVVALEHDPRFAEQTRHTLRAHELDSWATVIDAPLVELNVPGLGIRPWYDLTGLTDSHTFDLLFVDGPPGSTAPLARYPAAPQLLPWLSSGAIIVADDTDRGQEKKMIKMWSEPNVFDRPISYVKEVGRSSILRVDA